MKKYKLWITLSLVAVFAIGVAGGVFGERFLVHIRHRKTDGGRPGHPSFETMAKDLGLSAAQQEAIREIFRRNEERMKALHTEMHARLEELRGRLKNEMDAVLDDEQEKKLKAMIDSSRPERRKASEKEKPGLPRE